MSRMTRASRLFRLAHLLSGRRSWRVVDLSRELEVTRRTIYRDLDELSASGIPVYHDGKGYRLLDGASLPAMNLTSAERAVLILALDNPAIGRHAALAPSLRDLRRKLQASAAAMEEEVHALRLASADRSGTLDPEVLDDLKEAVQRNRRVRIKYRSLSGGDERWRGLDPYEVFHRSEAWYVAGHCHDNDELRTFRLDRIARSRISDRSFTRPEGFDLDDYLRDAWGIYRGDQPWDVVIHFDPTLAPLIDNARHHPGEEKRQLPSGEIEYRVRVAHLDEIARWVAGFEGKARAVEPEELAERVRALAAAVVAAHRKGVSKTREAGAAPGHKARRAGNEE